MPTLPVDDVELYYEWHGNPAGPVVVFVNGLLTDLASWAGHLPFFTDRYHCLVYDCRGQGQSAKPDHVYTIRRHSADLAGLLAALGIARAAIVGLSNGGATALDFAAAQPARVTALVVAGAYASVDAILRAKLLSWIGAMECGGSPLRFDVALPWVWGGTFLEQNYAGLQGYREKGQNLPIAPARNLIAGALVHDCRAGLPAITAPTLVVVGEDDVLTPPALARAIAAAVPRAELEILPGLGHAAALEQVEAFSRLVAGFLARVESVA
ncbi:MAG TPA: alpha/beta fold hydrolase [Chloroflexia bacterium]|nr:alpha/beta fold hydrolase [Chloroflexia bacterium]